MDEFFGEWQGRGWDILVRQAALEAVKGRERGKDEIQSVLDWVKTISNFAGNRVKPCKSPHGRCSLGLATAIASRCWPRRCSAALGYQTNFKTMAMKDSVEEFSHVYPEVRDKRTRQWIPLDPTVATSWPGWEPENIGRSRTYGPNTPAPGGPSPLVSALVGLGALFLIYLARFYVCGTKKIAECGRLARANRLSGLRGAKLGRMSLAEANRIVDSGSGNCSTPIPAATSGAIG